MISWISKTFSSVKITPENNAISIDNQQIKLLNPNQKREHRTGHPNYMTDNKAVNANINIYIRQKYKMNKFIYDIIIIHDANKIKFNLCFIILS